MIKHITTNYGKLDVIVPNAAVSTHFGNQFEISERAYDKLWDLNVKSTFWLIKDCLPLLRKGTEANVCIISSVGGKFPGTPIGLYGSCKAALDNMVKWMSQELMSEGIRVTGVAPGLIATHFSELLWKDNPKLIKESVGTSEEIGSAVALICSRDGRFMNGEVFPVHGGFAKL